jgi:sugar phosphate isomerase/epimerase
MYRRAFLRSIPAAAALAAAQKKPAFAAQHMPALAAAQQTPTSAIPIKLGFDTYSLRAFKWKAPQLVDYAGSLKLDTIQISSLDEYESKEPAYLRKIKDQAARYHMVLDGGMGCICPSSHSFSKIGPPARERMLEGLRIARAVGAKAMRCFMGSSADRTGPLPIEAHMENTINVFKSVRSEALDLGVKIAIENHDGDMQASEVKTIIEESGKDYVGSNLDTGNPLWVAEDPFVTLETLAPYVVTTHIRDSVLFEHPRGAAGQWVVLGDGTVDFVRFMDRFRELCPKSSMQLELITGRPPRIIPYLEPDFWKAFPKASAAEFARFVALAKAGHPYMGAMVVEDVAGTKPAIMTEALKEQQRLDLERSLEYAKKKLNVGINWRA